jgi:hypothetical protein
VSSFKNVSPDDLVVSVDGVSYDAPAGGSFTVPDEFDSQLSAQPAFSVQSAKAAPVPVPDVTPAPAVENKE